MIASDSQISDMAGTAKQTGVKKVIPIKLAGENQYALLGKSGVTESSDYFQVLFQEKAAHASRPTGRELAKIAQDALIETRSHILAPLAGSGGTQEERSQQILDYNCEMLLGYFDGKKPHLFTLNLKSCLASPVVTPFKAVGCAANLANSVLDGFVFSEMDSVSCLTVAYYAIEFCKHHDFACSGKTQLAMVGEVDGKPKVVIAGDQELYQEMAADVRSNMKSYLQKTLLARLQLEGIMRAPEQVKSTLSTFEKQNEQ